MGDKAHALRSILIRSIFAVPLAVLGFSMCFLQMGGNVITGASAFVGAAAVLVVGMMCIVASGLIIAPGFAKLLGQWVSWIYWPGHKRKNPSPPYSKVEARISEENYKEALKLLEEITAEQKNDPEPWIRMVDLLINKMDDTHEAELVYRKGIAELTGQEERKKLSALFNSMVDWDSDRQKKLARDGAQPPVTVDETPDEIDKAFSRSQNDGEESGDLIDLEEDTEHA